MSRSSDYYQALFWGNNQMPKRPTDTDIRHFTLNSCHGCNIPGGKVPLDAVEAYRPLLLDNRMPASVEEVERLLRAGGRHPLPGSDGRLGILATSDTECNGNELSVTIFLRGHKPTILATCRYYDATDGMCLRKWGQLVGTFCDASERGAVSAWLGFDRDLLVDAPSAPWLGVILTKGYDTLGSRSAELGSFLSSAEQSTAVTWRAICGERTDVKGPTTAKGLDV